MPRWSPAPTLVTTATWQRSKPRPSRRMPPRAVSNTAASTSGCSSTLRALLGPLQSPLSIWRPFTYTPSVLVMPTRRPLALNRWVIRRAVVVLPLVPVTATTGMRPSSPLLYRCETMASPTWRPLPNEGIRCMRRPGAAFTSTMPPCCSSSGRSTLSQTTSTPQMCMPTIWAAATARAATSGCTSSVTSVAVPPVLRLALLRRITRWPLGGTDSGFRSCRARRAMAMSSKRILVSEVAWPAARVGVHDVDQFAHGVHAVTDHLGRVAPGRCHQAIAHHQQAEVIAGQVLLDQHFADVGGGLVGQVQMGAVDDVDGHALALVAVLRLEHHRQADFEGGRPGVVGAGGRAAQRHGHASGTQQHLGQVFVLGDRFGHGAGGVHLGGLDATLARAPAKLHQAARGQAAVGDAPFESGFDDGAGAGAQAFVFIGFTQLGDGLVDVEGSVVLRRLDQGQRQVEGLAADGFFAVLDHHLVDAGFRGGAGAAVGDRAAGLRLQRQAGRLKHVGQRDRAFVAVVAQGPQAREEGADAGFEALQGGNRALGGGTFHHGLDGGVAAPDVGAAQGPDA